MTKQQDLEQKLRAIAIAEAEHTRERYPNTADEVYERLKRELPDKLRSGGWYHAEFEGIEFNDELRLAVITIGVKRGSVICRATVSDAGIIDGVPSADVELEFVVLQESKYRKPDQMAAGSSIDHLRTIVWGHYTIDG